MNEQIDGSASGDIQATADGKLREGERPCRACNGSAWEWADTRAERKQLCSVCEGTGVEPSGAQLSSTSVLSPPVPCSTARRAARSVTEREKRFVEAYNAHAAAQLLAETDPHWFHEFQACCKWRAFTKAACTLARALMKRAEGGDNK